MLLIDKTKGLNDIRHLAPLLLIRPWLQTPYWIGLKIAGAYTEQTRITYKMEYDKQFKMQVLIAKAKKSY